MPRLQAQEAPYTPSEAPEDVIIVRLGAPMGSNNFNSTGADGIERLVELPAKVRKMTLASRGMFAFVQLFEKSDTRVAGEVTHVISVQEVKSWRKTGEWPSAFDAQQQTQQKSEDSDDLPENPNRRRRTERDSEDESSEEESSDEE